jgi:hypothetical protein
MDGRPRVCHPKYGDSRTVIVSGEESTEDMTIRCVDVVRPPNGGLFFHWSVHHQRSPTGPTTNRGRREITAPMLGRLADFGFYEIVVPSPQIGRDVLEARLSLTTTDPP